MANLLLAPAAATGRRGFRPRRGIVLAGLLLGCLLPSPPGARAQEPVYQEPYVYGAAGTLRLKTYLPLDGRMPGLRARLQVPVRAGGRTEWRTVRVTGRHGEGGDQGWTGFHAPPAGAGSRSQWLCDLPLDEARSLLGPQGAGERIRLEVRREGWSAWWRGSWQGDFVPPERGGVLAWTYWLPNTPPPWQSTGGFLAILGVLIWIGCITAVRAEGRDAGFWRHAGWLHLPGALLFFIVHQAPPNAGLGREIKLPPLPRQPDAGREGAEK